MKPTVEVVAEEINKLNRKIHTDNAAMLVPDLGIGLGSWGETLLGTAKPIPKMIFKKHTKLVWMLD